ncbi:adenylate isopentenyltransferase 3, chloroplastic-like [Ananas comosus]|uniref:adenylate dimethylallyltransferase (ADP/ATP-dependent) n=1 Tax=Ananas comosus TaxID=4615 RepID=A0A6P5G4Y0_ANACO|nr:adenylate isopentenyltransferase 3, chloroplastic-like [Ananas comosus]XP_020100819.1 adenylate isopentenyltransferase 3, chloroplastic-like [Ananas comosus]
MCGLPSFHPRDGGGRSKVVVVMGATGTGKSRLAIDLALRLGGEVINCDKMQVYAGLNVITNKVTPEECAGVPHYLLGVAPPDADFTAADFRREATLLVDLIARRGRLPIIAGGSNSYIEELIEGNGGEFCSQYDRCFLWVDVELPVLHDFVADRVDRMVERGLVQEVKQVFDPDNNDYSKGIRKAIGVPEMDRYFRSEGTAVDEAERRRLLADAIDDIKASTCRLTCCQLEKIRRLRTLPGWDVRRVEATEVFLKKGKEAADEAWERMVAGPSTQIVQEFLYGLKNDDLELQRRGIKKDLSNKTVAFTAAASAIESRFSTTTGLAVVGAAV